MKPVVNTMDAEKLAEAIQKELDRHDENLTEEKQRHKRKIGSLKDAAGLGELQELAEAVSSLNNERTSLESDISKQFFRAVQALCPRKRQSASNVTIRDNRAWFYGRSSKIPLATFIQREKYYNETRGLVDEDHRELYDVLLEAVQRLDVEGSRYTSDFATPRVTRSAPDSMDFEYIGVQASRPDTVLYSDNKKGLWGWSSSTMGMTSETPHKLKLLVKLKPDVKDALEELEEKVQDEVNLRKDIKDTIKSEAAKHLVASAI